jgi:hypothetical protein
MHKGRRLKMISEQVVQQSELFRLTVNKNELKELRQGLLYYLKALTPEDFCGSDPAADSTHLLRIINITLGNNELDGSLPWWDKPVEITQYPKHFSKGTVVVSEVVKNTVSWKDLTNSISD